MSPSLSNTIPRLSVAKPSAIFKINNNQSQLTNSYDLDDSMMEDNDLKLVEQFDITIGISIEPIVTVESQLLAQREGRNRNINSTSSTAAAANPQNIAVLANKIVQHAYNFLSGFITPDGKVPMKAFDEWWNKFKSRINANPNFLDTLD
ncbi:Opi10p [Sugiyamaella lignohabitans]|uniref:Opi10p n=1 Tax=Sugiyamaella lignohabitans TaxID=796027 RepID=A0A167FXG9_9ASCO|nr:Opi10p [Sugiyamaella lignohabitans]ANB15829.1 Opi10p [Sugiyamaella lignohabitans]